MLVKMPKRYARSKARETLKAEGKFAIKFADDRTAVVVEAGEKMRGWRPKRTENARRCANRM